MEQSIRKKKNLPKDIVIDILFRLPENLLSRLFYNDSDFVKLHWKKSTPKIIVVGPDDGGYRNPDNSHLYIGKDFKSCDQLVSFKLLPFGKVLISYVICGISQGMICLTERYRCYWSSSFKSSQYSDIYLWNPLTEEKLIIHCPPVPSHFPINSPECQAIFGFGLLQDATICKVLRLLYLRPWYGSKLSSVSVYNVCTKSWKDLPDLSREINDISPLNPVEMVNECLHWIATVRHDDEARILSFNIKEETFKLMPTSIKWRYDNLHVTKLSGKLCMFDNPPDQYLEVWVMEEYGVHDSWKKLFKIEGTFKQLRPVGVAKNGQYILKRRSTTTRKYRSNTTVELMLYNVKTNYMSKIKEFDETVELVQPFKESLISVRCMQSES